MEKPVEASPNHSNFARKVWVTVGIITFVLIILFLLWIATKDILAIFAGILLAVSLHGLSSWLADRTSLSRKKALLLSVVVILTVMVAIGFFVAPSIAEQGGRLGEQLRTSLTDLESRLSQSEMGQIALNQIANQQSLSDNTSSLFSRASTFFSTTLDALVRAVIIIFVGFYLAYEPQLYVNGLIKLIPQARRTRYRETLNKSAYALRWWLVGRLASMAIVGILSGIGLLVLGIPLAFILGLLTGLLAFIPLIGPTLALLPPLLIAFTDSPQTALYVLLLYLGVQFVESYLLTPLIQRHVTSLPPVLLIASQVVFSLLAGVIGVMLAAPLAVVGMVMVKMLYVEDVLHDHSVEYLEDTQSKSEGQKAKKETKLRESASVSATHTT